MNGLTQQLGTFVTELRLEDVPTDAQTTAKIGFTDCYAVMIAGQVESAPSLVDKAIANAGHGEQASIVPTGAKRNVEDAALINGVSAHVLDYDDVTLDGHPSAVLVPAILAQGEASGANGAEMLAAYVAGYEVWAELLVREPTPLHQKGWHPTAMRGTIAAAAACARLRRLSATQTATAMAIAASMAAGLVANFGTLTKSLQVGRAAQSGVLAARLAAVGLTASSDALEHPSGFLAATSPRDGANLTLPFDPTAKEWHLSRQGLNIKRYPTCYATHRAIDAALELANNNDLWVDGVQNIRVSSGETQMVMLRNERPQTGFEAKFSMPFAIASAIVAKKVGLQQLTDEFVLRDDVQGLFPKVSYNLTKETLDGSAFAPDEAVEIVMNSGQVFKSRNIRFAKGSHQRPLSHTELREKFDDCLGELFNEREKESIFNKLMNLEALNAASELFTTTSRLLRTMRIGSFF